MTFIRPFLAQQSIPIEVVSTPWNKIDAATKDILIILGSVAFVTLLAIMWAVASRKRRRRHSRHHSHHHSHSEQRASAPEEPQEEPSPDEPGLERRRRRRRHRRREHRPRNPTLAETGGLPPVRTGRPPDPYP
jgi:hypothetical protein